MLYHKIQLNFFFHLNFMMGVFMVSLILLIIVFISLKSL